MLAFLSLLSPDLSSFEQQKIVGSLEESMTSLGTAPSKALFCNLDDGLSRELRTALNDTLEIPTSEFSSPSECLQEARTSESQIIFCPFSTQLISLLSTLDSRVPVVVVTRHPEAREWIDSIEAGATDYCAAPFEPRQLRWIMSSSRE